MLTVRNKFFLPSLWNRAFIVTFFFVTLASGLFWLDAFRGYRAEVTVLVVSSSAAASSQDMAANLRELTTTLSFYERLLADNELIDDVSEGYAPDERKKRWNDLVSVRQREGSGVLVIRAQGESPEMARRLAKQTAQTLFSVAGFYYDVKQEIDTRIIDGPFATSVVVRPSMFATMSLLTGLAVTSIFFWLLNIFPVFVGGRKAKKEKIVFHERSAAPEKAYPQFALGETVPWIDPKKFVPMKPSALSFETEPEEKTVPENAALHRKAPAPANLPVADEEEIPSMDAMEEIFLTEPEDIEVSREQGGPLGFPVRGEHTIQTSANPAKDAEPTMEEYKRRLNELLAGVK